MKNWKPSLAFKRFRKKHYELNRLYWTQVLSHKALLQALENEAEDRITAEVLAPDLPSNKHLHTVAQTRHWAKEYLNRSRLHLLVISAANLETYLKEITFWHLYVGGYGVKNEFKLNAMGKAISSPILSRSSLPQPLKYAQALFDIDFGQNLAAWQRYYKLRSAAAHNGGIVTARTLQEIPDIKVPLHQSLGLDWSELKDAFAKAEQIAKIIDQQASNARLRREEVRRELIALRKVKQLPPKEDLWQYVHKNYGLKGLKRSEKVIIESQVYD